MIGDCRRWTEASGGETTANGLLSVAPRLEEETAGDSPNAAGIKVREDQAGVQGNCRDAAGDHQTSGTKGLLAVD